MNENTASECAKTTPRRFRFQLIFNLYKFARSSPFCPFSARANKQIKNEEKHYKNHPRHLPLKWNFTHSQAMENQIKFNYAPSTMRAAARERRGRKFSLVRERFSSPLA
jgi:hypothetical protein